MSDDETKPDAVSFLKERTSELASIFHAKMLKSVGNNAEAVSQVMDTSADEVLEAMRHCQYCGLPIYTVSEQRKLLIDSDSAESAAKALYDIIAKHMNQCSIGKSIGAPPVRPPVIGNGKNAAVVFRYFCYMFMISWGIVMAIAGYIHLAKMGNFYAGTAILWFVLVGDRAYEYMKNAYKKS